jgi:hypothetical protein
MTLDIIEHRLNGDDVWETVETQFCLDYGP